jgi:hypothetical protein
MQKESGLIYRYAFDSDWYHGCPVNSPSNDTVMSYRRRATGNHGNTNDTRDTVVLLTKDGDKETKVSWVNTSSLLL